MNHTIFGGERPGNAFHTFRQMIEFHRSAQQLPIYTDTAHHKRIRLAKRENGFEFVLDNNSPYADIIQMFTDVGQSALTSFYLSAEFIGNGPKLARVTMEDCLALENVQARIPLNFYKQPFPTFAIEFPKEYSEARFVKTNESPEGTYPLAVILHRTEYGLMTKIEFSNAVAMNESLQPSVKELGQENLPTIEDLLERTTHCRWVDSFPVNPTEVDIRSRCLRISINFCILMTMRGYRNLGKDNPAHAAKLQSKLKKPPKHAKVTAQSIQAELNSMPEIFSLDSSIPLFRRETEKKEGQKSEGVSPRAHWRCGHFRNQHFGKANANIKLVFIEPVLVNSENIHTEKLGGGTVVYA